MNCYALLKTEAKDFRSQSAPLWFAGSRDCYNQFGNLDIVETAIGSVT
jgi:uncharacterized membrane protein